MTVGKAIERPVLFGIAVIGLILSGLLSFVILTPLGWGMSWSELAPTLFIKLFFLAPGVALIGAAIAKFFSRPSPSQEIALLTAPAYQAIFLAVSYFIPKPGA
ncbi:hypothetical protein [Brevundimonas sp.]|uniref:hypothetical protein n=1 Tax=Brevundimonas sp. TaxID=1871086 RepID=UPI0025C27976|nr:hypothetical protein [Brevundimonas sp.]